MRILALAVALALSGPALAQGKGFKAPEKVEPEPYAASTNPDDHTTAEVKKTVKTGRDLFIGSYITIDKTCKVGKQPQIQFVTQPTNGAVRKRRDGFNLSHAPGVPRNKCLGVSPEGIAVMYVSKPRFKGDDTFGYKVLFPDGRTRTVSATVTVQ
jgi:hypothetical protein